MNKIKCLIMLALILGLIQVAPAEKRAEKIPLEQLTDPSSPSYIPCPYPDSKDEFIENLKYVIKTILSPQPGLFGIRVPTSEPDPLDEILANLFKENSPYRIGQITKVKNYHPRHYYDYCWLILIVNQDNSIAARVAFNATGLWHGAVASDTKFFKKSYIRTDEQICQILSDGLGAPVTKKDVKQIERSSLMPGLGHILIPAFEIKLKNGETYYFRERDEKTIFRVKEKKQWKKDASGRRPYFRDLVSSYDVFAFDKVEDVIIVFEEVKKKGQ